MADTADSVARDLERAADTLADLHGAHRAAGQLVEQAVVRRVPRRTSRLAGSVAVEVGEATARVTAGGPGIDYLWPIHQGVPARGIAAHPFMTEAQTSTEADVVDLYLEHVDDALDPLKGN